jgi:hypothetical protein
MIPAQAWDFVPDAADAAKRPHETARDFGL